MNAPTFHLSQGDAVAWLRSLPSSSIDLFITDPAYESLEKHRAKGTTTRLSHSSASSNDWFQIFKNDRFPALFAEIYRVLADDAHFYMLCDQETMFVAKPMAEAAGFTFWKPLVWNKYPTGGFGMGYHYRNKYELILFFEKGKRKLHDLGIPDILEVKLIKGGYPTEKPPELIEILVRQSSDPGQLVADCFMGSGSAGVAAVKEGRLFAGNDLADGSLDLARTRLTAAGAVERDRPTVTELTGQQFLI